MDNPDHPYRPAQDFGTVAIMNWYEYQRRQYQEAIHSTLYTSGDLLRISDVVKAGLTQDLPDIAVGVALIDAGKRVSEGQWVLAVTPLWVQIVEALRRDSDVFFRLDWRQWEELVAGGYEKHGFKVLLTPRSNDGGVDIIATRDDVGAIRVLDQAKHYKPGHLVTAEQVHAMWSVLDRDRRASKACISTTSDFAPGAYTEFADSTPSRIELRNGERVKAWLTEAAERDKP